MRRGLLFVMLCLLTIVATAQEPVRFGDRQVYLEANVRPKVRGQQANSSLELGNPLGAKLNILLQFENGQIPYQSLEAKGIVLGDYLGANAYYAQVMPGSEPSDFAGLNIRAAAPIRSEWKADDGLFTNHTPEWATDGDMLKMRLVWFPTVEWGQVKDQLTAHGVKYSTPTELLRTVDVKATREELLKLAELEAVAMLTWVEPPKQLFNQLSAQLSGAAALNLPTEKGGLGLTGKGVRVGIWDGNVKEHMDYGNRVHIQEAEYSLQNSGGHGMHTTGTIIGNGLLDEKHRGMAPEAEIWTWNFGEQSNGKSEAAEMLETYRKHHISITSHSYGYSYEYFCDLPQYINYSFMGHSLSDLLAYYIPDMIHVYAAGNDQGACKQQFGHATQLAKNIISVGGLNPDGRMSTYSSFGPLPDGRIFPVVSARGTNVYSTVNEHIYKSMKGTSMATPTVSGHLALLTQRWMQLHGGAIPPNYLLKALVANTADDAGNPGPDYKFGFGILNARAALTALEKEWYVFDRIENGATKTHEINVPEGVGELRVMLVWNDPVAKKRYASNESPMVNDLDLSLTVGGTQHLPLTLDMKNPDAAAVEKVNSLDNTEQIVVTNPAMGTCTVEVKGVVRMGNDQPYVIAYYFDYKRPAILSPLVDEVYAPGDTLLLRTQNLQEPVKVEITRDGGATYKPFGKAQNANRVLILGKTDKTITNKAMFRVTDARGYQAESAMFTIMHRVVGVKLLATDCSKAWKLTWKALPEAEKFEILRADAAVGVYENIGTAEKGKTEFDIPEDKIAAGRNVFAVRAIGPDDVRGPRSIAAMATVATTPVTITELPYLQAFEDWPNLNVSATAGSAIRFVVGEGLPAYKLPLRAHYLLFGAPKKAAPKWENPFETQPNYVAKVNTCEIDLSKYAGKELQLLAYYFMAIKADPKGSLMRVLINDQEEEDFLGRKQIEGDGDEHYVSYDISKYAGQKIKLRFEFALQAKDNIAALLYYKIIEKEKNPDVGIAWANNPEIEAKAYMGVETVNFKVQNYSSVEATGVPVSLLIDGKVAWSENIEKLKPFEEKVFAVAHDFSSEEAHKYKMEVRVHTQGDTNPANNASGFEVYNMGNTLPMPEMTFMNFLGYKIPIQPRVQQPFTGKMLFTDGRGPLENYKPTEKSVVRLVPKSENAVAQLTFKDVHLTKYDTIAIFTHDVNLKKIEPKDGEFFIKNRITQPLTFVSEARDGSITVYFSGYDTERNAPGWLADLEEVVRPNQWQITDVKEVAGSDATHVKIQYTVKNLLSVPVYDLGMFVTIDTKDTYYPIATLPVGETVFTLPDEYEIMTPMRKDFFFELAIDGDPNDNKKVFSLIREPIWNGGTIKKPRKCYIKEIVVQGSQDTIKPLPYDQTRYMTDKKITLYTKSENALQFTLSSKVKQDMLEGNIRLWVDLNDDNKFGDNEYELFKAKLEKDKNVYLLKLDYSAATDLKEGEHRMRVMLCKDDEYENYKAGKEIEWGHVVDFTAELKTGNSPYDFEVALLQLVGLKSSRELSNETEIKVRIRNNGLKKLERVKLAYKVNDAAEVEQEFTCDIAPGSEGACTFTKKADLSEAGMKFKVVASLKSEDKNTKDNEVSVTVVKFAEKTDAIYSLAFNGEKTEFLHLGKIGTAVSDNKMTIEGYWKLDEPQLANLVAAPGEGGLTISTVAGIQGIPDNSLAVVVGEEGVFISKEPVLKPGEWQHIAVTIYVEKFWSLSFLYADLYVNGVKKALRSSGDENFAPTTIVANYKLKGENAMLRFWNNVQNKGLLKKNMTKSVRTSDGKLPDGCIGEFIYTEGKGYGSLSGEGPFAFIRTERDKVKVGEMWKKIENALQSINLKTQVLPTKQLSASEYEITVPFDANLAEIEGLTFEYAWGEGKVVKKDDNTEVEATTKLDFATAADNKIAFQAECELFGKKITQDFTLKIVKDLSNACDLKEIALLKEKNPGLKADITKSEPVATMIAFEAQDEAANKKLNVRAVKLLVKKIAEKSKLFVGETEHPVTAEGAEIQADLSLQPLRLRIVAENGRDEKNYYVKLAMGQTITWEQADVTCTYGDNTKEFSATATSALPVEFRSLDPNIATVNKQGKLITVGLGETMIAAKQEGNEQYTPAAEVTHKVTVTRANLKVKVKDMTWPQGSEMPDIEFEFEGPIAQGAEYILDWPYEIQFTDGKAWDGVKPLEIGEYKLVPKNYTAPYDWGNYKITRETGKLMVTAPTDAKTITFKVVDGAGTAVENAMLTCGEFVYTTQADGTAKAYILADEKVTYKVVATKDGYRSDEKEFVVTEDATITLTLLQNEFTLTYTTDEHGIISGNATQKVPKDADGEEVIAVSKDKKYRFKKWDDGVMTAARTDKKVTANKTAKAEFEEIAYTLVYEIGEGGKLIAGNKQQTVKAGADGAEITIEANPGYAFCGWSDGGDELKRTDKEVWGDKTVKALFMKPYALTWKEDFQTEDLTNWQSSRLEKGQSGFTLLYSDANVILGIYPLIEKGAGNHNYKDVWKATPWFSIENRNSAALKFAWKVVYDAGPIMTCEAKLQYRFEDAETWMDLATIAPTPDFTSANYPLDDTKLGSHKMIRFRMLFSNPDTRDVLYGGDNIKIAFDPEPANEVIIRYFAAEHGKLKKDGTTDLFTNMDITTTTGTLGAKVVAVPDDGYEFVKWSDGKKEAERQDQKPIMVTAFFKKKATGMATITYKAKDGGIIQGAPQQKVELGSFTSSVTAKPNEGFLFTKWDDNSTANPRSDKAEADKTFTAEFEQAVMLTYTSTAYGHVEGNTKQTVGKGTDGTEVEAVPDAGCEFLGWSDGLMTPKRTDKNVQQNITVEARFAKVFKVELVVKSGEGTIEIEGYTEAQLEKVPMKSELTVVAKPKDGWKLTALKAGKSNILKTMKFTVYKDVTVEAVFEEDTPVREATFAKVSVAPNPFAEQLTIKNEELLGGSYVLLNANGQRVRSGVLEVGETHIPTGELTSGLYLLRLTAANGATTTYRLVK